MKKEWDANKMADFAICERIAKRAYPILSRLQEDEVEPAISYNNAVKSGLEKWGYRVTKFRY